MWNLFLIGRFSKACVLGFIDVDNAYEPHDERFPHLAWNIWKRPQGGHVSAAYFRVRNYREERPAGDKVQVGGEVFDRRDEKIDILYNNGLYINSLNSHFWKRVVLRV